MTKQAKTWHVSYRRNIEYEIVNSENIFDLQNDALLSVGKQTSARRFVVAGNSIEKLYGAKIREYFAYHGIEARIVPMPGGEDNKSIHSYFSILEELDRFPINRRDEPIIAIGGGILTDIAGFVASSYRRGVPHIKVPTTLMGYVDASVGIKNGVNFNGHKNRLGSFLAPQKVLLDKSFLETLPKRHILNGVCEIIKLAVIKDEGLFAMLEMRGAESVAEKFQNDAGEEILNRAITGMIEELEPNLFEDNLARSVDFGHTFAYGLETHHDAHLLHGEAVLLDIVVSVVLAANRNLLSDKEQDRIFNLLARLGHDLHLNLIDPIVLWESLHERTYHRNGFQHVPLPDGIGNCTFVNDVTLEEIQLACKLLENRMVINGAI